jgi:protein TonB
MHFALPRSAESGLSLMPADLGPLQRVVLAGVVVLAHGVLAWVVWHWTVAPQPSVEPPVITAQLVVDNPPPSPSVLPQPEPARPMSQPRVQPQRVVTPMPPAAPPVLSSARSTQAAEAPPATNDKPVATPVPVTTPAVPVQPANPVATPAPNQATELAKLSNAPKELPRSAVRYLSEPPQVYPRASRDLGETGVVQLKVLVDEEGHPKDVQVTKSSGFPRLDRQAVLNMKAARFQPHVEGGVPRAVWVPAEIVFNLE